MKGDTRTMDKEQVVETVQGFDGVLVIAPGPGSGFPEPAWGDMFFYYAPDGRMPAAGQPYGTIVTSDQPGDDSSDLDPPGRWRVNVQVGRAVFRELTGEDPGGPRRDRDAAAADRFMPHPVYGALGWVAVVNPGTATGDTVLRLLREAHEAARARFERRREAGGPSDGG